MIYHPSSSYMARRIKVANEQLAAFLEKMKTCIRGKKPVSRSRKNEEMKSPNTG